MSNLNTAVFIVGTLILVTLSGLQYLQLRSLEQRIVAIELDGTGGVLTAAGLQVRGSQSESRSRVAGTRSGDKMENAESTSASSGLGARGGATSESKPIVVSSEEALAKIVASETDRLIEKKRARWAEIGEESLNETVREFATENGLGDQDVEELTSLMSSWQSDRRYLHEGLMDGSISVTEMRNEMRQSKEQLEQEVEALIGEEAASVLLEPMLSRRGHF